MSPAARHGSSTGCTPFLKWPGGKRQLLEVLAGRMPERFNRYFEPFVGAGALFFRIMPPNGCISDINPELITVYEVVRDHPDELIASLKKHRNSESYYYRLRAADRTDAFRKWTSVEKASRTVFLNKTCFNGLYRMNSRGHFNVPYGFYKRPRIFDEQNLRACNRLLQTTEIARGPFQDVVGKARRGDFVYFDPPYVPLTPTSSFTRYYKDDFTNDSQIALKEACDSLDAKGVHFMLSNSFTPLVRDLYRNYHCEAIGALRTINSKGSGRGKINELLITNY